MIHNEFLLHSHLQRALLTRCQWALHQCHRADGVDAGTLARSAADPADRTAHARAANVQRTGGDPPTSSTPTHSPRLTRLPCSHGNDAVSSTHPNHCSSASSDLVGASSDLIGASSDLVGGPPPAPGPARPIESRPLRPTVPPASHARPEKHEVLRAEPSESSHSQPWPEASPRPSSSRVRALTVHSCWAPLLILHPVILTSRSRRPRPYPGRACMHHAASNRHASAHHQRRSRARSPSCGRRTCRCGGCADALTMAARLVHRGRRGAALSIGSAAAFGTQ